MWLNLMRKHFFDLNVNFILSISVKCFKATKKLYVVHFAEKITILTKKIFFVNFQKKTIQNS